MTAKAIGVIWWIVGTFGIGGLIATWFFFPTISQLVLQRVVKLFSFVLSYRIGCALLAAIAAGLIVDQWRHSYDDTQFAARTAAFEQAQRDRDSRIAQQTRQKVSTWADDAAATSMTIDNDVKGFNDAPPPAPPPVATGNPLFISDADADRLCKLAGQTVCGSVGSKGVPKTRRSGGRPADQGLKLPHLIRTGVGPNQ